MPLAIIYTRSTLGGRMAMRLLILTVLSIYVHGTLEAPPKLTRCRQIHKARTDISGSLVDYAIPDSCGTTVTFPLPTNVQVNATDPRNCDNYYSCAGTSCLHCPCPENEWFDPITLRCSADPATCKCTDDTTSAIPTTYPTRTQKNTTPVPIIIDSDTSNGPQAPNSGHTDNNNNNNGSKPLSNMEIIIIAAIISVTVIIVVIIVMAVFLWQRRNKRRAQRDSTPVKFTQANCSNSQSAFTTYAPTTQPCERHIYAEIDENKAATEIQAHWQHGSSVPPVPVHRPPASSTFCPIHNCSDSGVGSADTSFTSMFPRPIPTNAPALIRYGGPFQPRSNEEFYNQSSCSASSDYSQSSQQTSLDSQDVDVANLLPHNGSSTNRIEPPRNENQGGSVNYVSKHVYI